MIYYIKIHYQCTDCEKCITIRKIKMYSLIKLEGRVRLSRRIEGGIFYYYFGVI